MPHNSSKSVAEAQPAASFADRLRAHQEAQALAAIPAAIPAAVSWTIIKSATRATKRFTLVDGRIVKEGTTKLFSGRARRETVAGSPLDILTRLSETLRTFDNNEVLVTSPPISSGGEFSLVRKTDRHATPGAITRSKEHFRHVEGPALFGMDFDVDEFPSELLERIRASGSISAALTSVFPPFASAACLRRRSSSGGVRRVGDGADSGGGQHRFFIVDNGCRIEQFVDALAGRLMLAGFIWIKIAETGRMFPRTLFDVEASRGSERLFYEADAVLGEGLEYAPGAREPVLTGGGVLDISSIQPLTADEQCHLDRVIAEARKKVEAEAAGVRNTWIDKHVAARVAKGSSEASARRALERTLESHELSEDFEINMDDGSLVSVGEIVRDPKHFDGKTCADPFEPEYGGGRNLAVIQTDYAPYRIYSHAHGGIEYSLPGELRFFDVIEERASALANETPHFALKSQARRFQLLSLREAAASALTQSTKPLLKGFLDQGALSVLYGESNVGKTFVAMDIGFHVAAGMEWAGCRAANLGVIYVAAEGGLGARRRTAALVQRYGSDTALFHLLPDSVDLRRPDADLAPLIDMVNACGDIGLIVIDTLSRALAGGDENSSTDMGALVKHIDLLRRETRAHVMLVHHSGKDRARGARGHSLLRAATDTEIEIADNTITVTKQRDLDGDFRRAFVLDRVELGKDGDGDPITSCVVRLVSHAELPMGEPTAGEREVLDALAMMHKDNPSKDGFKPEDISRECVSDDAQQVPVETIRTRLRDMEKKRLVKRPKRGRWCVREDNSSGKIGGNPSTDFPEFLNHHEPIG